jgi:predicted cobalt transporter CbtA
MSGLVMDDVRPKAPWHLWVVGVLALLWNGAGTATIMAAQFGAYPDLPADEAAYYAAQKLWFVAVTDLALLGGVLGGAALLLRSRWAATLFALSLVAIAITNGYDLAAGTSGCSPTRRPWWSPCLIWLLAILQLWYAAVMRGRGVLR